MMENLLSNRLKLNLSSVPESYILPVELQPGKCPISACTSIPIIDLSRDNDRERANIVHEIIKACKDFGFFQVINHGVDENMTNNMMSVAEEFFQMAAGDDAIDLYSDDYRVLTRVHTSLNYGKEDVHYWRDNLKHPSYPIEEFRHLWPSKPTNYRDVTEIYTMELRRLGLRLLELICEGLGIDSDYGNELSKTQYMSINRYPPCPDPSVTLGVPKHTDPSTITLLHQGNVPGLQVLKDGEWIAVAPLPNTFVVNLGNQLEIISNGILHSAEHRVVTNSSVARTTIVTFLSPSKESIIEPCQEVVDNELNPPKFRAYKYQEFLSTYLALWPLYDTEKIMKHFKL